MARRAVVVAWSSEAVTEKVNRRRNEKKNTSS